MHRSPLPEPDDIVVDRVNNDWVLTCTVKTILRLRIQHSNRDEPLNHFNLNDAICEISEGRNQPFREVGRPTFECIEFNPDLIAEPDLSDWPTERRAEFIKLARVWTALTAVAEWGYAIGDGQAQLEAKRSSSGTTATEPPRGDQ